MKPVATWFCLFLTALFSYPEDVTAQIIKPKYSWSKLEYDYSSKEVRQAAIDSGEFTVGAPVPIDVDVHYLDKNNPLVFITTPLFRTGVPATLGTITNKTFEGNPIIAPYPSWDWHRNRGECPKDRIVSVVRVKVDECGRLWMADNGGISKQRICPAQILAFDLKTNELIHRYEIPESQLQSNSLLVTPVVDVRDPNSGCTDTFVYVADSKAHALIVHDVKNGSSWQIIDKTMYPYPNFGTWKIAGQQFDLMDGILGAALSPYVEGKDRILYYHAMTSGTENWVSTANLRNQSLFATPTASPGIFNTYLGTRPTQCPAMAIDKKGIAYFGLASFTTINCWNTKTNYNKKNIGVLYRNRENVQFVGGIKVITNEKQQEELWFITNRFQKVATGTLNTSETNFRMQSGNLEELMYKSKCLRRN